MHKCRNNYKIFFSKQYGLYSSFMACFVYTIFGSCKDVPVGPTAIVAILTRETLQKSHLGSDFAILLTFVSGCVCLLMGILQLGEIIDLYHLEQYLCLIIFFSHLTFFISLTVFCISISFCNFSTKDNKWLFYYQICKVKLMHKKVLDCIFLYCIILKYNDR